MSLKVIILLAGASGVLGIAIGYYLRVIIALGKRGSMELQLKQMELHAKEEAKKIVLVAEQKATETMQQVREEIREKEEKLKKTEDRLITKESFLDKRQVDIDKEVEHVKEKVAEIKDIREKTDQLRF